jgi:hypothetical protein
MSTLTSYASAAARDSAAPAASNTGLCIFRSDTNAIEVSDGTNYQTYNSDGVITPWSGLNDYSMNFDGTDDRLNVGSVVTSSAQQGTISFWIKTSYSGPGQNQTIFTQTDNTTTTSYLFFGVLTSGEPRIGWSDGSSVLIKKASGTVNDGNWHHLAYTSNGSTWKIYIDGSDQGTLTTVTGTASDGNWFGDITSGTLNTSRIGCQERTSTDSFLNGNIDELAVWDSALTAAQITNIYKGESSGGSGGTNGTPGDLITFGPSHWWRMGDGTEANSGTTVYDMSINSVNATVVNATSGTNTSGAVYQADTP